MKPRTTMRITAVAAMLLMVGSALAAETSRAARGPEAPMPPGLPSEADIMAVPPELHAQFQANVLDKSASSATRIKLLLDYTFDKRGLGLTYDPTLTRTVAETFRDRKANCLSFTLLFVALAREAGISAHVQEVGQVLTWYQEGDTIYDAGHVNVGLQIGGEYRSVDLDRNILFVRKGPKAISDDRAIAHFYNNRGSELMADGHSADARRYLQGALALAPTYPSAWNNLGVLDMREGDTAAAEHDFLAALDIERTHAPTLSNIVQLYRRSGDAGKAQFYLARLERARLSDPFHQYTVANEAEKRGDYPAAVAAYRRAIRLYSDPHQFHFGLARTYFLMGETGRARRELSRALALDNNDDRSRARYQAKLDSLRRYQQQNAGAPRTLRR
jgi:tetratricopeptide (TPR) repeat protein